ncbi:mRNA-decapping enzyme 1b-like [Plakobranchus ocellatus]|uniref:mRNA-decapping enzyme 1b-like n=1 Tax=Plakobranchus ocellatus TaxID=259542 RepID=A0AAV4A445_9GAST|nr:mRNA-decapping enzyme 1b-like [Plakobranchus ocellatus]
MFKGSHSAGPSVKRSASPTYGLIILNRKDLNNLVQPLTNQVEFHLNTPFLLYKKLSEDLEDAILGIWFMDRDECIRLTSTIQRLLREVSGRADDRRAEAEGGSEGKATTGQNILSLLSNAQKTYDQERGATQDHSDPRPIKHPSGDASGMSQISLDDLFRTVNLHQAKAGMADSGTDTGPKSSMFARSVSVSELEAQQESASNPQDTRHPILKLISTKTVEELEKQHLEEHKRLKGAATSAASSSAAQRRRSPRTAKPASSAEAGSGGSSGGGGGGGAIDLMQLLTQGASKSDGADMGRPGASPDSTAAMKRLIKMQDPQFGTNRGFIPVPTGAQQLSDIESSHPGSGQTQKTPTSTQAQPPSVFALPKDTSSTKEGTSAQPLLLKPSDLDPSLAKSPAAASAPFTPTVNSLLTPQAFSDRPLSQEYSPASGPDWNLSTAAGPAPSTSTSSTAAPLTREQLQQAMLHLIKNDSNFLTTVHAAYLESFHAATTNSKAGPNS